METPESILKEAKQLTDAIASSLPDQIQIAALSLKSKLPFKALSLREVLIHRVSSLATAAIELFEREATIPAVVLARAVLETVAVMYSLNQRLLIFFNTKNIAELDDFLMRSLMGARNNPDLPKSINVKTLIDKIERIIPGFNSIYANLCECTHPNWAGTFGAFGEIDRETFEVKLGPKGRTASWEAGISALSGSLLMFHHYYNESADLIKGLNDHFEQEGNQSRKPLQKL